MSEGDHGVSEEQPGIVEEVRGLWGAADGNRISYE